ncbi:uncharacterized protein RAG0_10205 [Rhynchosporium agropyri]|uniref:F-box domain-containing protein n=1 Tax=Rhynchosporium agropyri TaxID=914238 RepID=A0A1E1KYZ7_9HELO|nr:uncharacterized protein RAG0_10205 [Rhynchosporium agropyri]
MASQILRQGLPTDSLWDLLGDMLMPVLQLLSPRELHVLSLVSKASRAHCEPLLYSSIEWTWLEDRPPPITAFIRTILRRPELAAHVRSVSLLGDSFISYQYDRPTIPPRINTAALDYQEAMKAMELTKVNFKMQLSWRDQMAHGTMDILTTLLLSQLYRVRKLVLGPIFTFETGILRQLFLAAAFKQASHEVPTYQHLQVVCLNFSAKQGRHGYPLRSIDLQPWFYLPAVRDLAILSSMPMEWDILTIQTPASSLLTTLHLTAVEPKHLGQLLSMTPALQKLRYNWYYRSGVDLRRPEEGSVWINLDDISLALLHVRKTLEVLVITGKVVLEEHYDYDFLEFEGTLGRIVDLHRLKSLQIPLPFLTGEFDACGAVAEEEMFPRNLESLTITDDLLLDWPWKENWDDDAVSSALQRCTYRLRNLKRVKTELCLNTLVLKGVEESWSPFTKEQLSLFRSRFLGHETLK